MQNIMDQKDTSQIIDDGASISKTIAEIVGVSNETLLNEVDILNRDSIDNGNMLQTLDQSLIMDNSEKHCVSNSKNSLDNEDSTSCVKEYTEKKEVIDNTLKICDLKTSSDGKNDDTYQSSDVKQSTSERNNEIDSVSVALKKTDDLNNTLTELKKDCSNAKDNCKSLNNDKIIDKTTVTSSQIENTGVLDAEMIDVIEETILIPSSMEKEHVIINVDEKNVTILTINDNVSDSKVEQIKETLDCNIIDYMDVDGNQTIENSASTVVDIKIPGESDVTQSPSNGSVNEDKIDLELSTHDKKSISDASKSKQSDVKINKIENGEHSSKERLPEKVDQEKSLMDKKESPNAEKKRSVIEDIFDDWMDENPDEESSTAKAHDDVEQELKSLLEDDKNVKTVENINSIPAITSKKSVSSCSTSPKNLKSDEPQQNVNVTPNAKDKLNKLSSSSPQKAHAPNDTPNPTQIGKKSLDIKAKPESKPVNVVNTTNQTKSVVETSKELKSSKDKEFESPRKEIIIVKKVKTKSPGKPSSVTSKVPQLIALDSIGKAPPVENKPPVDNKELLAILEGDEDPDWSDLTPPKLIEESNNSDSVVERNSPPKLDPLIERELALKQLLELPASPKKTPIKKKPLVKPMRGRPPKEHPAKESREASKTIVNIDLMEKPSEKVTQTKSQPVSIDLTSPDDNHDIKIDETRSGRKRKPTEKAREHEISAKRQKIIKNKIPQKKLVKNVSAIAEPKSENVIENNVVTMESVSVSNDDVTNMTKPDITNVPPKKEAIEPEEINLSDDDLSAKTSKELSMKKAPQPNPKRKVNSGKNQPVKKSPAKSLPKKSPKATKTTKKNTGDSTATDVKPKKKIINEIDRLLQDEGVVNLLYDVEQPGKKRLIPVTKSQAKVMDIQKVQRELKIRTKLVRNAVLRLRTSGTAPSNVTPRSKRSISHNNEQLMQTEKKSPQDSAKSPRSSVTSPTDFMYPAKIRNAADASIIVRRHSSSSFSSASGSPRVSIDGVERYHLLENNKMDDNHTLRSNKRRLSQEDKKKYLIEAKRNKKEMLNDGKINDIAILPKGKVSPLKSPKKTAESKKGRSNKSDIADDDDDYDDVDDDDDDDEILLDDCITMNTRSNGASGRNIKGNKRNSKGKVSFVKENEDEINEEPTEQDDALSACLAEAVTALANDNGRTRTTTINRKTKSRSSDLESSRARDKIQFRNKEINVQRHGNLVQLILTPSTSSKIRNGITLQMMLEFREVLTILKKDDDCRVVLLTSTGSSFCEGLELSELLQDNKDTRRHHAQQLANGVKDFIKSLATFNKPIVAGVQGSAVGLGVTMLPLFDLVIASDKASFSTPYGKLGQIAEGAAVFTLSHVLGSAVTSELLLGGRTLTANEALRAGLVTRVLWPDRFQVELLPSLRAMSDQSSQSMEATKALLRHSLRKKIDAALESESYLLIQHWCSAECQEAIRAYMDEKVQ
ncbi:hypothetical protein PV327_000825 [Microctonus hyperodae]|uniref:Uncharacterized protein n=1 Tax=Microctonus hyperodae TaxID=165561 RepID=A0AA39G845_MICHY|nr:hypothetical protein PV327_000825 [Microctonus hyperodae]